MLWLTLTLSLTACLLPPDAIDARIDVDGDGFVAAAFGGEDCDDADATVFPGAAEGCDARDADCDGRLGTEDADGDGFPGCEECNDANPNIHPDATEICDDADVDEDCDGLSDDDDDSVDLSKGTPHWPDLDGDGLGSASSASVLRCDAGDGFTTDNGDCDDTDVFIPMPHEWCRNGLDEDCGGVPVELSCGSAVAVSDLTWSISGPGDRSGMGQGLAIIPDITGDGLADIAIGASHLATAGLGEVYLFSGLSTGIGDPAQAYATIVGPRTEDAAGYILHVADGDGDGELELLVGLPGADLLGGVGALIVTELDFAEGERRVLDFGGPLFHGHNGVSGPFVGGVNGFGSTDDQLVMGIIGFTPGGPAGIIAGFEGGLAGLETVETADWSITGNTVLMPRGSGFAYADVDGDGTADVVASNHEGTSVAWQLGPFTGHAPPDIEGVFSPSDHAEVGAALSVGDYDGDGVADVAVSSRKTSPDPLDRRGVLHVLRGPLGAGASAHWTIQGPTHTAGTIASQSVLAQDIDDDGAADLIWGVTQTDEVWLVYSGLEPGFHAAGTLNLQPAVHELGVVRPSGEYTGRFGSYVAGGGDVNGDGRPDVLLGDPYLEDSDGDIIGTASLMLGGRW